MGSNMKYFSILALTIVALVAFVTRSGAVASDATAQLSATMNEFVTILVNTPVAELRQTGLPDKALKLINSRFDFSEMTKQSLGAHWNALEANEQQEFIDAYTQMVLRFFGRSVRAAGDETIQYKREVRDGILASVETKVVSGSRDDFAIDQRSIAKNEAVRILKVCSSLGTPGYLWTKLQSKARDGSGAASSLNSARISSMAT